VNFQSWLQARLRQFQFNRTPKISSVWTILISFVVIGFFAFSLRRDWKSILTFEWQLSITNLVISILLHSLAIWSMFMAWHLMMHHFARESNWKTNFRIYSLSLLARRIPLPIWYVGSRVYFYRAQKTSSLLVLTATALEFAMIAITGLFCYVILLPWYSYSAGWPWWIFLSAAIIFFIVLFAYPNLFISIINRVLRWRHKPTITTAVSRKELFIWGFFYLATWFIDGLGLYFTVAGLVNVAPPVASVIGISTISAMVALASTVLPGGFGPKEITMGAMLGAWMPLSAGLVISIVYRLLQTIIETVWTFIGQQIANPVDSPLNTTD
jgi:hypothetical protein